MSIFLGTKNKKFQSAEKIIGLGRIWRVDQSTSNISIFILSHINIKVFQYDAKTILKVTIIK